jgi:predicted permease
MRFWRRRRAIDRDLDDELRAHVEHRADDLVRQGLAPDEARRRARVELGAVETYRDQCRETRRLDAILRAPELLWRDLHHAARRLAATPMFVLFATVSLALGLSLTVTAHAFIYEVLWKPIGAASPESLHVLYGSGLSPTSRWRGAISHADYDDLASHGELRDRVAASMTFEEGVTPQSLPPGRLEPAAPGAVVARAEAVTGSYFSVLGVPPSIGRVLVEADDRPDASAAAVLGDRYWRRQFQADPAIVGRTIRIGGHPVTVVGVAAARFNGLGAPRSTDFWMSRSVVERLGFWTSSRSRRDDRAVQVLSVLLRADSEASLSAAGGAVSAVSAQLDVEHVRRVPEGWSRAGTPLPPRNWRWRTLTQATDESGRLTMTGRLMIGLAALVLVVACTNLGNLLLGRGVSRAPELAVRRALGASRTRLVREFAAEAVLIAGIGGLVGWALTRVLLAAAAMDLPYSSGQIVRVEPELQPASVVIAIVALGLSLLVFGLGPALRLTRHGAAHTSGASIGASAVPARRLWRSTRWQVAASTTLFLVSAIAMREVAREARHDNGIDTDRLAMAVVTLDRQRGQDHVFADRLTADVIRRLRQTPGIENASAAMGTPFGLTITPLAHASISGSGAPIDDSAFVIPATSGTFDTWGVPIVAGRSFKDEDNQPGAQRVAVISELAAETFFGNAGRWTAGRSIDLRFWPKENADSFAVVGIARDTDVQDVMSRRSAIVYVPMSQHFSPGLVFSARSSDPEAATAALRLAIGQADRDLAIWVAGPAPLIVSGGYLLLRLVGSVVGILASSALLLSMVGLFGVLSQVIARQTREMGIRLALGATAARLRRAVIGWGLRPVVTGLTIGLGIGLLIRALLALTLRPQVPIAVVDWAAIAFIPVPILMSALLACYVPALRAARVDPNVALRE